MKIKYALALLAIVSLIGLHANVQAAPFELPADQPVFFQFNNLEQVDLSLTNSIVVPGGYGTAGNWGLINMSSIQLGAVSIPNEDIAGGPVIWADDGPGGIEGQITGIFYDLQLLDENRAAGGSLDLFWQEPGADQITADILAGNEGGPDDETVALFTGGEFLARLNFASGILPGDPNTTLFTDQTLGTVVTEGVTGSADSFANVDTTVVGAWTQVLDNDWFHVFPNGFDQPMETRDIRFSTFFNHLPTWDGEGPIAGLRSNDPGRVFTAAAPPPPIPEPGTIWLLGLGCLLGIGVASRKLRAKKN